VGKDWWNARLLHIYSHAGTHLDAPIHYEAGPLTIDQIPLERCITPAWMADCSDVGPREKILPENLDSVRERFREGEGLLIRTGWSRFVNETRYRSELPRISEYLARWCIEKKVSILGVEPPAVADLHNREELTRIHEILLGGGTLILEGLANLQEIRRERFTLIALPLKIVGGDGSPVRAVAIEDD
jgi:kynurenine formamidase